MPLVRLRPSADSSDEIAIRMDDPGAGAAPFTILYLHGFGSRQSGEKASYFRARAGQAGVPFCSFDFRGHGESDGKLVDLTFSRNLEDLAAVRGLLNGMGIERVALFGSSMGGAVALWHAAMAPESILAVASIAPALGTLDGLEQRAGPGGLERWRREGVFQLRTELVDSAVGWGLVEDLRKYPIEVLASRIRRPSLIFQGKLDATVDWRFAASLVEKAMPNRVTLRLFEDGDHRLVDRLDLLWDEAISLFVSSSGVDGLTWSRQSGAARSAR